MSECSFARIVSARIVADAAEAKIVLTLDLLSKQAGNPLRGYEFPLEVLHDLMGIVGADDFDHLKDGILRVGIDGDGDVASFSGPEDGAWVQLYG